GEASLQVDSEGASHQRLLRFAPGAVEPDGPDPMAQAGLALAAPQPMVGNVNPDSAGEAAGLRTGDVIVSAGDLQHPGANALVQEIQKHAGQALAISVLRDGALVTLDVTPKAETSPDG